MLKTIYQDIFSEFFASNGIKIPGLATPNHTSKKFSFNKNSRGSNQMSLPPIESYSARLRPSPMPFGRFQIFGKLYKSILNTNIPYKLDIVLPGLPFE
jgi:hypothetical protein